MHTVPNPSFYLKTIFFFVLIVQSFTATSQQASPDDLEDYNVAPKQLNNDRTLKLAYIRQSYSTTTLYVTYTCVNKATAFSGLYLNNLRIVDKATGKTYTASNTYGLPTRADSKFFLYNLGTPMMLRIDFPRLPRSVKVIDVLEGSGAGTETYNFTFKNVNVSGAYQMSAKDEEEFDEYVYAEFYAKSFYTHDPVIIDIYVDNHYIGKLEKYIPTLTYTPKCHEDGTFTVCFPTISKRRIYATAKTTASSFTWNFEFTPGGSYSTDTDCSVLELKTK
ncbi:hypothetical protein [Lacibacter sediminis]|uniref:Uncharacterized protein n=1 Tax=Lacibacter sediminis TaxID=2760713 RepID=A0A7G5XBV3_9BACT|nr:hypothetical protein [Lacibacter sediminis]QNA42956.1 hypothetical protein H4075_12740 [Lacibacter sediminis]